MIKASNCLGPFPFLHPPMAQALLSILSISVGIVTACDFETLVTECTPPTGIQDSAYCGQFVVYEECASNAGCLTVRSVTKVLDSARYRTACEGGSAAAPRPTAPRVTTSGGNFYLNGKVSRNSRTCWCMCLVLLAASLFETYEL